MFEKFFILFPFVLTLKSLPLLASSSQNILLLQQWKKADQQLSKISTKETELTNQKLQLELALNETTESIQRLTNIIAEKRDYILKRVRYLNQESGSDFLRNFMESNNPGELDRNMRFYLAATRSDLELLQQYNRDISKLEFERKKYAQRIAKVKILKNALQQQLDVHMKVVQKKNELLTQIKNKMKTNSSLWQQELKLALKNKNNDKIQFYQSLLNKSLLDRKGRLTSPTDFAVKYGFGAIKLTPAAPALPFHGVLFDSPPGALVKAIADGFIAWMGPIEGLGDTIILDHGREIHSLYSRVTLANLHIGDMIEEGTIFSRVNKSTDFIDNGLYFELREHGKPTNPLRWILSKPELLPKDSSNLENIQ